MWPTTLKRFRQSCVLVDIKQRRAIEIILNTDKLSGQRNQEIDNFVCWQQS